jgi:cell shape-determining protein MreC
MNFHRQNNSGRSAKILTATIVFAGVVFALNYGTSGMVRQLVQKAFSGGSLLSVETIHAFGEAPVRDYEQEALKRLRVENDLLRTENAALRKLDHTHKKQTQVLRVVSHTGLKPYGTLTIEKKDVYESAVGAVVLADAGFAIGTIDSLSSRTAQVALFSAAHDEFDALTTDIHHNPIALTVLGSSHGNFIATVPRDVEIKAGTLVTAKLAYGSPIGEVKKVVRTSSDSQAVVHIAIPFSLDGLRFVEVQQ